MKKFLLFSLVVIATFFSSCSSSKSGKADSVVAIESLSEEVEKNADEWSEEEWNEAAEKVESALSNLPDPLETKEELSLSSSLAKLKVYAGQHQRRAARMLAVLEKFEQKNGQKDKGIDGVYDLQGSVDIYPVSIHFEIEGKNVKGSYYYVKHGPYAKLSLSGTNDNGNLDINEVDESGTPTGHFVGKLNNGVFKGVFKDNKGRSMPFLVAESGIDTSNMSISEASEASNADSSFGLSNVLLPSQLKGKVEVINAEKSVGSYGFPEMDITFKLLRTVNTSSMRSEYGQMWIVGVGQTENGVDVKELLPNYREWRSKDYDGKEFKAFLEGEPGETITLEFTGDNESSKDVAADLKKVKKFKLKITN